MVKTNKHSKKHSNQSRKKGCVSTQDGDFQKQLSLQNLRIKTMHEDGNCLFRSLADQIYGDCDRHIEIRSDIIAYMRSRCDHFALFIEDDEDSDAYFERLSILGEWGGNLELYAAAELFKLSIMVMQPASCGPFYVISPSLDRCRTGMQDSSHARAKKAHHKSSSKSSESSSSIPTSHSIMISYHGGSHYNSIRPHCDPDEVGIPALCAMIGGGSSAIDSGQEDTFASDDAKYEEGFIDGDAEDIPTRTPPTLIAAGAGEIVIGKTKQEKDRSKLGKELLKMKRRAARVLAAQMGMSISISRRGKRRNAASPSSPVAPPAPPSNCDAASLIAGFDSVSI